MILVLKHGTTRDRVEDLCEQLETRYKIQTNPIYGKEQTIIGLVGDTSRVPEEEAANLDDVERVVKVQEPFKRANRKFHPDNTVLNINGVQVGGEKVVLCAGPCAVEGEAMITEIAASVKASGAALLRGGAFKPRTSPYAFQGLRAEGLHYLKEARDRTGLPVVSEITNPSQIDLFLEYVDVIQVGARNMQNFDLLRLLGQTRKPILLKRGLSATIEEWLMAAEYIMAGGNGQIILCERGIRTFETYTRNTLDLSAIVAVKNLSHLPIIVDPSHATGKWWMVEPLARAAVAVGADGLIIEVHNDPAHALCDGNQSIKPAVFADVMKQIKGIADVVGREVR